MKKIIKTEKSPQPIGPYVQAININNIIITSGQIPIDNYNNIVSDNISEQTKQALKNIKNIIYSGGFKIKDIIKINIYTTNIEKINDINSIYENFFIKNKSNLPARTCVEVSKLPKNAKIEIEAMAIKK